MPNPSQHVPIYLQQFPSYSNRKCKKSQFSRTTAHIFVSPGDAPAIITQYVAETILCSSAYGALQICYDYDYDIDIKISKAYQMVGIIKKFYLHNAG